MYNYLCFAFWKIDMFWSHSECIWSLDVKWIRLCKLCSEQKIVQCFLHQKFRLHNRSDGWWRVRGGECMLWDEKLLSFDSSLVLQMTLRETRWILKTACIFVEFCTSALFVGWQRESNDGSHHPGRPHHPVYQLTGFLHLSPLMRMTKIGWHLSLEACNHTLIQRYVVSHFEWSDAERPTPLISCCTCNAAIPGILLYLF